MRYCMHIHYPTDRPHQCPSTHDTLTAQVPTLPLDVSRLLSAGPDDHRSGPTKHQTPVRTPLISRQRTPSGNLWVPKAPPLPHALPCQGHSFGFDKPPAYMIVVNAQSTEDPVDSGCTPRLQSPRDN